MAGEEPQWYWERATCSQDACNGIQLLTTAWCLAHAAEEAPDAFADELQRINAEGTVDGRGVVIGAELLAQLLEAVPRKDDRSAFTAVQFQRASFLGGAHFGGSSFQSGAQFGGASFHGDAVFGGARFQSEAVFGEATFKRRARFSGASFRGRAGFDAVTFEGRTRFTGATFDSDGGFSRTNFQDEARFDGARFEGGVTFSGTRFQGEARFHQANFQNVAWFDRTDFQREARFTKTTFHAGAEFGEAAFHDQARFDRARFNREAGFEQARFRREARFSGASFQGEADFGRARFQGEAWFDRASFQGQAWFDGASFEGATQVGPLLARQLVLDGAVFSTGVQLEVTAAAVCARRAQFPAGAHLRLRFASIVLDDANLAAPVILASAPFPFPGLELEEEHVARRWKRLPPEPGPQRWRPRLLSIRRADVAGLRLADVDLRACRFAGAVNLDRLHIEGTPLFARTAGWWRARRKTLAEEQQWRVRPGHWRPTGWYPRTCQPPASPNTELPKELEPVQLAALYRDLRKGREDAKDEPGAADFYYGECEMRRHGAPLFSIERWILTLYWLVSGYALRASRAILAWAMLVAIGTVIFAGIGFKPPVSPQIVPFDVSRGQAVYEKRDVPRPSSQEQLAEALAFSAESTVSLLRAPDRALTLPGRWTQMILRIIGPVLFGLAVLSLRGRVRR